jgi:acetolactate synthase-1/2/3 large subunit
MNGAELFVHELQKRGVTYIATLCGHGLDTLFKACQDAGMRLVDVRNEQAAGYMAEVTGRLTRQVGVCAVSSGVAHANALTGVLNAHFDGAPMLLITGSGPTGTMGRGHFQDMDQVAMVAPICKYAQVIKSVDRIPLYVHEAFSAALAGRPGPVHVTFPMDVQTAEVEDRLRVNQGDNLSVSVGAGDGIGALADALSKAKKPLMIAGNGLYYAHGEDALARFVEAFPVPVVTPIWDRGSVPKKMDAFVGVIGAATGGASLMADADLILMVGARCDYRVGYLQRPAIGEDTIVARIDGDAQELQQGIAAKIAIHADPSKVLGQLADEMIGRNIQFPVTWLKETQARRDNFRKACLDGRPKEAGRIYGCDIVRAVQEVLTDETVLLIDGGNIGQWAHQILCDRYPGHWMTCGASGVVGYGIPGAMAAKVVYPDRPVLLISGDGSITFTIAEFESAARQGLPFVALLADDEAWGSRRAHQNGR